MVFSPVSPIGGLLPTLFKNTTNFSTFAALIVQK